MEPLTTKIKSYWRVILAVTSALAAGTFTLILLWLLGSAMTPPAQAQAGTGIIRVAATGADAPVCGSVAAPCATVQYAVDIAQPGEEILVASGLYTGVQARAGITQVVYISKTLTLRGGYTTTNWNIPDPLANPTTLDAQGLGRVMFISGTITPTVEGLRLTGGDATGLGGDPSWRAAGGGMYVYSATATISGCVIYSNTAGTFDWVGGYGGGLYLYHSDATLLNNIVQDNIASTTSTSAGYGGGLYLHYSDAVLQGNLVQSNTACTANSGSGGGLYLYNSAAMVLSNTVQSNAAGASTYSLGGGLTIYESDAEIKGNLVQSNTASTQMGSGGGLYLYDSAAMLRNNTVINNIASITASGSGGGLYLAGGGAILLDNTVISNTASTGIGWWSGKGGGLYVSDNATLQNNTVQGNVASTVSEGSGGGLYVTGSRPVILYNTVHSNVASTASSGSGGGLYLRNVAATIEGNLIFSNTAALSQLAVGYGGGLYIDTYNIFTLTNNLLADNHANTQGSGLWVGRDPWLPSSGRLLHTTIADNHGNGQGVYVGQATTLTFTNTIIAGHNMGITVTAGSTATLKATLWYSNGTNTGGDGTIITGTVNIYDDPAFANPAVWDYHLNANSAAVDAGVDTDVTTDFDGEPRPWGRGYDIGADESHSHTCWARLNDAPTDYISVQAAVDASAQVTDVVKVAGYCAGVQSRGGLTQTVYLSKTLTLRGGYTTTNWTTPDPLVNPTTLDAQGLGRALVISGTITPTVEGLRITGGDAAGLGGGFWGWGDAGGGVYIYQATATISDCVIYSNTASTTDDGFGGGLCLDHSDAALQNNTIINNTASTADYDFGYGGGLSLNGSAATLQGNTVISNTAGTATAGFGYGGGLYLYDSAATLESNTVQGNTASIDSWGEGGGLSLYHSDAMLLGNLVQGNTSSIAFMSGGGGLSLYHSDATLLGNTVQGNTASATRDGWGGGLFIYHSAAMLESNIIISNTATLSQTAAGRGGGLRIYASDSFTLTNNLIADNHANTGGSGLWVNGDLDDGSTSGILRHTTIANNHGSGQGVYVGLFTTLDFTNTIVAGHNNVGIFVIADGAVTTNDLDKLKHAPQRDNHVNSNGIARLQATLWYSNGANTGGDGTIITGTVNVYDDPAFANPATWDYHLNANSAAIDAGVDAGVTTDIDGELRPQGADCDIGADEFYCYPLTNIIITGPTVGMVGAPYTFTAAITPPTATLPISYTWTPTPTAGQGTDKAAYTWDVGGEQVITITAENCGGEVSDAHSIYLDAIVYSAVISPTFKDASCVSVYTVTNQGGYTATMSHDFYDQSDQWVHSLYDELDSGESQVYDLGAMPEIGQGYAGYIVVHSNRPFTYTLDACPQITPPCTALTGIEITGPTAGAVGASYTFTAAIAPPTATLPITYTWTPTPTAGQGTDEAAYIWDVGGEQVITITAENCGGELNDTHSIYLDVIEYSAVISPTFKDAACVSVYTVTNQGGYTATMAHNFYDQADQWVYSLYDELDSGESQVYDLGDIPEIGQGYAGYVVAQSDQPFIYTLNSCPQVTPPCTALTDAEIAGPTAGVVSTPYTFTAAIGPPTATLPITYTWTPTPMTGQGTTQATYTWDVVGEQVITITAENCGGEVSDTHTVVVTSANQPPVANAGSSQTVNAGDLVTLDGAGSSDPDGDALTYDWTQTGGTPVNFTFNLSVTTFTAPTTAGVLSFTLTITDAHELSDSDATTVTVTVSLYRIYLPIVLRND